MVPGISISSTSTIVLGFSFTMSTVEAGCGVLFDITGENVYVDVDETVLSDAMGQMIEVTHVDALQYETNETLPDKPVHGEDVQCPKTCYEGSSCDALFELDIFQGIQPLECAELESSLMCDCTGCQCLDCAGVPGGNATYDECGECGGNSASCTADIARGCNLPVDTMSYDAADGAVLYHFSQEVAGVQFLVRGGVVKGVSGGDAEKAGWYMSASDYTVIGISFNLDTIAAGCGILMDLVVSGEATHLDDIILSDAAGKKIEIVYSTEHGCSSTCMGYSCDHDILASLTDFADQGTCSALEELHGCDCSGCECVDCHGTAHGSAVIDSCGVCGGDSTSCISQDTCLETCNGAKCDDSAQLCSDLELFGCDCSGCDCLDCADTPGGDQAYDKCGICGGDSSTCVAEEHEACTLLMNTVFTDGTAVLYNVDRPFDYFNFDVTGGSVLRVDGGDAAKEGFITSVTGTGTGTVINEVVGISKLGKKIGPGCGILTEFTYGSDTTQQNIHVLSSMKFQNDGETISDQTNEYFSYHAPVLSAADVEEAGDVDGNDTSSKKKGGGGAVAAVFIIIALASAGGGGFYYWKNNMQNKQTAPLTQEMGVVSGNSSPRDDRDSIYGAQDMTTA